jgi:DNA-binding NtrC family response regulator
MPLKVVYIDDEPDLCQMFVDNFANAGVEITTFLDANQALRQVPDIRPNLIIIDYRLPTTTGDALAAQLPPEIPKALISGDLAVHPRYPFTRLFTKPFDFAEMDAFLAGFASGKP